MNFTSMNLKAEYNKLKIKVSKYESGEAIIKLTRKMEKEKEQAVRQTKKEMKAEYKPVIDGLKAEIRKLKEQNTRKDEQAVLNNHISDNQLAALKAQLEEADKTISQLRQTIQFYAKDQLNLISQHEKDQQIIDQQARLIEELTKKQEIQAEIIRRQNAIIEKDHTNSSIPSSQKPNHPTIKNSRTKTGRKPGGQSGHKGARRPDFKADRTVVLPVPPCAANNPERYELLEETKARKVVSIQVITTVTEFISHVWKDKETGRKIYSQFPDNCVNELNYDETVKAFLCLLANNANVSIRKTSAFLNDVSEGRLRLSAGMIYNLRKEFDLKSKKEQEEIRRRLLTHPYMNIDTTFTRIAGKTGYVGVCTNPYAVQYTAGAKKGFDLMDRTAAADYLYTVVHDGEKTMFKYGAYHQECLVHLWRYILGIAENEPEKLWPVKMKDLIIRVEEVSRSGKVCTEEEIQAFENEFDAILDLADSEYEKKPLGYADGFNTKKRLRDEKDSFLFFLRHPEVPFHNNSAELQARELKRKTKASDGFRSFEGADSFCNLKSVLGTARLNGINEYEVSKTVFSRTKENADQAESAFEQSVKSAG